MNTIDTAALSSMVVGALAPDVLSQVEMRDLGPSGLSIRVEGPRCLTSIGVWPNGCCDVDYLFVASEQGKFDHYEFGRIEDALAVVVREVHDAVKRAR